VLARLGVLALGQRVHRADLLAPPGDPRQLRPDLLAFLVLQRRGRRRQLLIEHLPEPLQLGGALVAAVS
jgi:hypothetical protein